ncbi:MAG: VF530 family DNA-binding protein [Yersinia sp. (in: enterobacteria)]
MNDHLSKDPLQGITLEQLLIKLVEHFGWRELAYRIRINCFTSDPSIKSSLKFLRSTPWARVKVEELYIHMIDSAALQARSQINSRI